MTMPIPGVPRRLAAAAVALTLALAACSSPPAPQKAATKPAAPAARNLLAEVRAAGADGDDSLDVQPLRDPEIEDLRASATRAETAARFDEADGYLREALAIAPDDPDLLQWRAELALAQARYDEAVQLASRSYETGPKLGALCRRNWTAVKLAREMTGHAAAATAAAQQAARCTVEPPVRM